MKKYSVWLVPEESGKRSIQNKIDLLSSKYGGEVFTPHLTIVGEICGDESDIKRIFMESIDDFLPMKVYIEKISFSTTFFQDVFILIKPTSELLELNLKLKKKFDMPNDFFVPHISIMYGYEDIALRETISQSIEFKEKYFMMNKIVLVDLGIGVKNMKEICEKVY